MKESGGYLCRYFTQYRVNTLRADLVETGVKNSYLWKLKSWRGGVGRCTMQPD